MTTLYLIRHATPDWNRKDIPYDIPPGPPLAEKGKHEAMQLAEFLRQEKIQKLYYSPLERAKQTAIIIAEVLQIPIDEVIGLAEWRPIESKEQFAARFLPTWEQIVEKYNGCCSIGLVTHGGPIRFILEQLGIDREILQVHRKRYDGQNPLPPAGVWKAEKNDTDKWDLKLVFTPAVK
jgi:broad specificity phosphatase PhoE